MILPCYHLSWDPTLPCAHFDISLPSLFVPPHPLSTSHFSLRFPDSVLFSWGVGRGGKKKWKTECEQDRHMARCRRVATSNLIFFVLKCSTIHATMNFHFTYVLGKENHLDLQKSVGDVDLNCYGLIPSKDLSLLLVKRITCTMIFYKMFMFGYSHTLWTFYIPPSCPMTNRFIFPRMLQL